MGTEIVIAVGVSYLERFNGLCSDSAVYILDVMFG